ncbi:MAG: hypothetical protein ABWY29_12205 [Blastococcus sp.]
MTPVAGPPPVSGIPRSELMLTLAVIAVLTVAATMLGLHEWAQPERVFGGWQVAEVPATLAAMLAGSTVVCLVAATALTVRTPRLRLGEPAGLAWLGIVVAAAAALVVNALVLAADASDESGPVIPVLHWLFTLVPALLAGAAAAPRGAAVAGKAALGTGVVTVPLFALGWALLASRQTFPDDVLGVLWTTVVLGAGPLALGFSIARNLGQTREWRAAAR